MTEFVAGWAGLVILTVPAGFVLARALFGERAGQPRRPRERAQNIPAGIPAEDGMLVTHAQVLALLPPGVRADFDRLTDAELRSLHDQVFAEHRRVIAAGGRDPHAAHVLFAYSLYERERSVGGWLEAAAGMGERHGTTPRAVALAVALAQR